jgi:hypothetical protein
MALLITLIATPALAKERSQEKTFNARTVGLQKLDGYVPLYWDPAAGKMLMEIWTTPSMTG